MKYLKVSWIHDFDDEPILIYHEIDESNFENRKIEFYKDESFGFASKTIEFGGSLLSTETLPAFDEIRADPQFILVEISEVEFEDIWYQCMNYLKK